MAAGKLKLTIDQGATFTKQLTWKTGTPAVAVDLTGYTARMQIRPTIESSTVLVSLTTENGGIALGGTAGTITLTITATATAAFTWTEGVYDLELVSAGGVVTRLLKGAVTVTPEVTR